MSIPKENNVVYLPNSDDPTGIKQYKSSTVANVKSLRLALMSVQLRDAFMAGDDDSITTEDALTIAIADLKERAVTIARHLNKKDAIAVLNEIGLLMNQAAKRG